MKWIKFTQENIPDNVGSESCYLITDGQEIGIGWYEPEYIKDEDDPTKNELIYSSDVWHDDTGLLFSDCCGWPKVTHYMILPKLPSV